MTAGRALSAEVAAGDAGRRLDAWLARAWPELSRARIQSLIADGAVTVDGVPVRASTKVRTGQRAHVTLPEPAPAAPEAQDIPIRVVWEDAHLLVVDKPAGLVVHPGAGTRSGTLVNALLHHVRDLSGVGGVLRPGIVHRLDRGTSGLIVVAKSDEAHRGLAAQFAGRAVEKHYLAVVHGVPRSRRGTIEAAIGRHPVHRKKMSTEAPRGRPAKSTWELAEGLDGAALLDVRIHTGRTHQIRVHLASAGHPIVGDATYGGMRAPSSRSASARAAAAAFPRPALHAASLAFTHPVTGEPVALRAPLPEDIAALVLALRGNAAAR
jgi:23S rRNA pseudouridine1911/1915/1917 synthase